jgi:hypothetical protein
VNLYLVILDGFNPPLSKYNQFYVIASSMDSAYKLVKEKLNHLKDSPGLNLNTIRLLASADEATASTILLEEIILMR